MRKLGKLIKKIIDPVVSQHGFHRVRPNQWDYKNDENGAKITIDLFSWPFDEWDLRIHLSLENSFLHPAFPINYLNAQNPPYSLMKNGWEVHTLSEAETVLYLFVKMLNETGFNLLQTARDAPKNRWPAARLERELYENHTALQEAFVKDYPIDLRNEEAVLTALDAALRSIIDAPYEAAKPVLLNAAAAYGALVLHLVDGTWVWNKEKNQCQITNNNRFKLKKTVYSGVLLVEMFKIWQTSAANPSPKSLLEMDVRLVHETVRAREKMENRENAKRKKPIRFKLKFN